MAEQNFDLVVVGAGPCGIATGAAARATGLATVLFERGCVTQSLIGYPYYMTFLSTAEKLEIASVPFTIPDSKPTRREALAYFRRVVQLHELDVRQYEEVVSVTGVEGDITVHTRRSNGVERAVRTRAIAIATGGFSEPNWLGVPGEGLPKVLHYYREPYPFYDQDILVVGGRNSAVESALEMFRNGARVTMVHFQDTLDPGVKAWVIPDIANRLENGEIQMYFGHRVAEVKPDSVVLRQERTGHTVELANQWVLAMTGWRADQRLLRSLGVVIDDATGIPAYDSSTMQTNVPGVFVAGVLAAGHDANKIFIENGRDHGALIARALVGSGSRPSSR